MQSPNDLDLDKNHIFLYFNIKDLQGCFRRRVVDLPCLEVELGEVESTDDGPVEHESVREVVVLMGADPRDRVDLPAEVGEQDLRSLELDACHRAGLEFGERQGTNEASRVLHPLYL